MPAGSRPSQGHRRRAAVVGLVLLAVCVPSVWLIRQGDTKDRSATGSAQVRALAQSWADPGSRVIGTTSRPIAWPFAGAMTVPGGMPPDLRSSARETLQEPRGSIRLQYAKARRLFSSSHKILWLVPRGNELCLFRVVRMAATCAPTRRAYRDGLVIETFLMSPASHPRPIHFMMVGVAPDGTYAVRAAVDGRMQVLPVEASVFQMQDPHPINVMKLLRRPS
jgi:hypothetical protein